MSVNNLFLAEHLHPMHLVVVPSFDAHTFAAADLADRSSLGNQLVRPLLDDLEMDRYQAFVHQVACFYDPSKGQLDSLKESGLLLYQLHMDIADWVTALEPFLCID